MKYYITLTLLFIATASFAQDIIKTMDGKIIEASIKEIGENSIVYKLWNSNDGPDFRINKENVGMVKLRSGEEYYFSNLFQAIVSGTEVPAEIKSAVFSYKLLNAATGSKLSDETLKMILSTDQYDSYLQAQKFGKLSISLCITGLALSVSGLACTLTEAYYVGSALSGIGLSCAIAAIPFAFMSSIRIDRIVEDYNKQRGQLAFSFTGNGIGFCYSF